MFKSEAEHIMRAVIKETGAQFTEEQILALSQCITKIASRIVEEAFASFRPGSSGKPSFFS